MKWPTWRDIILVTLALVLPFGPLVMAGVLFVLFYQGALRAGGILLAYAGVLTALAVTGMNYW